MHALSVPGPDHRGGHGPGRGARLLGGRDGLRGPDPPGLHRAGTRPRRPGTAPVPVLGRRRGVPGARPPAARSRAGRGGAGRVAFVLTVLGCSGSYPGPAQACSGYLLRCQGTVIWLDAGSGTLANLQRHVGLAEVDAVVLTHEHPDHWSDIEGYAVA